MLERFRIEDGHQNPPGYQWYLDELFAGHSLVDKSVLEVGSGRGLLSLYCATSGARRVLSLEPEMEGSANGSLQTQRSRIDAMGLQGCIELRPQDFNLAAFGSERFDIVLLNAVLNHLYETPHNARVHRQTHERYVEIVRRLYELTEVGGLVIVTDACRYCLWTQLRRLGFPARWCLEQRTIQWRIHQQPGVWTNIFEEAGFCDVQIQYPVPYRLRRLARMIRNPMVNFMLTGLFICRAYRS